MSVAEALERLAEAAREYLDASDAFEQFERENLNDCTKNWSSHLYARIDAKDRMRQALARVDGEGEV